MQKRKEAAQKRWKSTETEQTQCDDDANAMQNYAKKRKGNKNNNNIKENIEEKSGHRFTPPTLSEVEEYITANGYTSVDPQQFIDHYTAVGWVVGRNPMKNWQAAVRNWNRRSSASLSDPRIPNPQTSQSYETSPKYQAL